MNILSPSQFRTDLNLGSSRPEHADDRRLIGDVVNPMDLNFELELANSFGLAHPAHQLFPLHVRRRYHSEHQLLLLNRTIVTSYSIRDFGFSVAELRVLGRVETMLKCRVGDLDRVGSECSKYFLGPLCRGEEWAG